MDRLNLIIAGLELIIAFIAIYSKPKRTIKYFFPEIRVTRVF